MQHSIFLAVRITVRWCVGLYGLARTEDVRSTATFGTLPHPLNRITVVEFVATGMVDQDAHHVPDFAAGTRCPSQMLEPYLHFDSFDVWEDVVSPTWNDPFAKV